MDICCASSASASLASRTCPPRRPAMLRASKSGTSGRRWWTSSRGISSTDLKDVVNKLIPDSIARDIEKACQGIYPLHDVHIRKVKVMKRPRFDLNKLMDMHGEGSGKTTATTDAATGEAVERPEGYEPPVLESV